jgi:HPr kinase/phosphorylase
MSKLNTYLKKVLSKEIGVHGVCINVFGVGILLRGKSGIGKSELALALIERGHRLISDDLVILKQIGPEVLVGTHNETNRKFLSLRGIGLINFTRIYGYGSYQEETKIELDILISPWEENTYYDAVGTEEKKVKYLDIEVKHIEIPIRPGRDLAGLIEVAARNLKLKNDGYDPLKEFQKRLEDKNEY